jgi:hypothetical protein
LNYVYSHRLRTEASAHVRQMCSWRKGAALLLGAVQFSGGCASARLTQFHNFAQAGTAYVKASQVVLDEAGTASVDADSLIAIKGREGLPTPDERRKFIVANNDELKPRCVWANIANCAKCWDL